MTVLVVARDLNMGDVIAPSDLAERTIYEDDNTDLYILSDEVDRVVGGVAALPMFAGQPVYRIDFCRIMIYTYLSTR